MQAHRHSRSKQSLKSYLTYSLKTHSTVLPRTLRFTISWKCRILALIYPRQLQTPKPRKVRIDVLHQRRQCCVDILKQRDQQLRRLCLNELESETLEIVPHSQGRAIEDAFGESADVHTGKGICGAGVAANRKETRVAEGKLEDVG